MTNYYCRNCNLQISTEKNPSDNGCNKANQHSWINLGESGSITFNCRNCRMQVLSKKSPNEKGCNAKGASNTHIWVEN
jgi:hypothetical protein